MKTRLSLIILTATFIIGCEQGSNSQDIPIPPPVFSFAIFEDDQNLFSSNNGIENSVDSVQVLTEFKKQSLIEISSTIQELDGYGFFSSELLNDGTYYIQINDKDIDTLIVNKDTYVFNGNEIKEQIVGFYILRK